MKKDTGILVWNYYSIMKSFTSLEPKKIKQSSRQSTGKQLREAKKSKVRVWKTYSSEKREKYIGKVGLIWLVFPSCQKLIFC